MVGAKVCQCEKIGQSNPLAFEDDDVLLLPLASGMGSRKNDPKFNIVNKSSKNNGNKHTTHGSYSAIRNNNSKKGNNNNNT